MSKKYGLSLFADEDDKESSNTVSNISFNLGYSIFISKMNFRTKYKIKMNSENCPASLENITFP